MRVKDSLEALAVCKIQYSSTQRLRLNFCAPSRALQVENDVEELGEAEYEARKNEILSPVQNAPLLRHKTNPNNAARSSD